MSNSGEETEASYERQCYNKVEKASEALNIFEVPNKLRKVKEDAYSPRLVSIGIYHRQKHELAAMQEHKYRYRRFFEKRLNESATSLKSFEEFFIHPLGYKVASSYVGRRSTSTRDIVLDGVFILELFLRYYQHYNLNMMLEEQSDDPIFNTIWIIPALRQDLALVENQIPFFILQTLFEAIKPHLKANGKQAPNSLTSLALHFFEPAAMKNQKAIIKGVDDPPGGTEGYKHLLDLLHKFYLPSQPKSTNNKQHPAGAGDSSIINITNIDIPGSGSYNNWGFNYCASQLLESGIEIERQSSEKHLLNITFSKGVIRIPSLFIDDNISLLRNLIAYEQYSISSNHITSYPILLKSLIRSSKDIKILRQRRIINSNWIDDEVYLAQCHSILDEVVVKDFCFADLCNQVNAYARKFWFRRRLKSLYRTYFSTAWSLISFIAAFCLFVLTVIQTYYAIHPR
ncbi:hypothetical protein PRUPE_6G274000 [Prunus persica]|uniref:Uncharacterized protein n=1 Tax=Prunus persica TaxID=3760 RepID=M5WI38_PRUPE|nr:UPF0481 protein At3g47200 [Prunus persica]ONI03670.1 hypothetical protein PRUPE_6G274000 [Prunus persica]